MKLTSYWDKPHLAITYKLPFVVKESDNQKCGESMRRRIHVLKQQLLPLSVKKQRVTLVKYRSVETTCCTSTQPLTRRSSFIRRIFAENCVEQQIFIDIRNGDIANGFIEEVNGKLYLLEAYN
mmetsp:Transcript_10538/g.15403  ORF Transcript_10538/g.15403 Transcript_10538/m.15403 type:complete len:123 (+) Transcript_10538:1228-1596(+)